MLRSSRKFSQFVEGFSRGRKGQQNPCCFGWFSFPVSPYPVGPARHLNVPGQKLPRDNFCLSIASQLPPEGPARHLDASRQKLTPHCLAAIFDSQLPSPKLSLKMPPKLPLPHNRGIFSSFKIAPVVRVTARQLSGKNCLAAIFASRHRDASPGPLGPHRGANLERGRNALSCGGETVWEAF